MGGVLPHLEFKLIEYNDFNMRPTDKPFPRGELCLRGASIIPGYFKQGKINSSLVHVDKEGWLHTGEIAQLKHNGAV